MEIDQLLGSLAEEGLVKDHGHFTLHSKKGREKYREFQMLKPGLWLTKCLQAAIRWKSPIFKVFQRRTSIEVYFEPKVGLASLHQLFRDIHNLDETVGQHRELATAVQSALVSEPTRFRVQYAGNSDTNVYGWEIGDDSSAPDPGCIESPDVLHSVRWIRLTYSREPKGLMATLRSYMASQASFTAMTLDYLDRVKFSPVAAYLDGRLVNAPRFAGREVFKSGVVAATAEAYWAAKKVDEDTCVWPDPVHQVDQTNVLSLYRWENPKGNPVFSGSPYQFAWAKGQGQQQVFESPFEHLQLLGENASISRPLIGRVALRWDIEPTGPPSLLIPIHLGVQLEGLSLDFDWRGLRVYYSSHRWSTDLSQSKAIQDEFCQQVIDSLPPLLEIFRLAVLDILKVPKHSSRCLINNRERALHYLTQLKEFAEQPL